LWRVALLESKAKTSQTAKRQLLPKEKEVVVVFFFRFTSTNREQAVTT
jgi:hypothetical protein